MNSQTKNSPLTVLVVGKDRKMEGRIQKALKAGGFSSRAVSRSQFINESRHLGDLDSQRLPALIEAEWNPETQQFIDGIRKANREIPLIGLVSIASSAETAQLLNSGLDDVVSTHADDKELNARIRAVLRRASQTRDNTFQAGDLVVDLHTGEVRVNTTFLRLTSTEQSIVHFLASKNGQIVSRRAIYNSLYAFSDKLPFEKSIDVHIHNIRKKLKDVSPDAAELLRTANGRGYALSKERKAI